MCLFTFLHTYLDKSLYVTRVTHAYRRVLALAESAKKVESAELKDVLQTVCVAPMRHEHGCMCACVRARARARACVRARARAYMAASIHPCISA